jgi:hypothetical protein
MNARRLLLAAPVCLALGALATAQQTSVTPLGDTPFIKPTLKTEPWVSLPNLPPAPPPTVNKGWVKLPNLAQAPPPTLHKGEAASYCSSTLNSSGFAAKMDYEGTLSCVANDTCLHALGCPSFTTGFFIYGNQQAQIPLGNGYLCVSPFHELYRISPVVAASRGGEAELDLDLYRMPLAVPITAGSTWNFQYWFRDPLGGGAGWNLSDGLRITFGP